MGSFVIVLREGFEAADSLEHIVIFDPESVTSVDRAASLEDIEAQGASMILRGLRAVADFEYEFQMAGMNQQLNDSIETVFLMADVSLQPIASKLVKEIARYGGSIEKFVTPLVAEDVRRDGDRVTHRPLDRPASLLDRGARKLDANARRGRLSSGQGGHVPGSLSDFLGS